MKAIRFGRGVGPLLIAVAAWTVAYELHALIPAIPDGLLFSKGFSDVMMGLTGVMCLLRAAAVATERSAWALIGAGIMAWTAGDVYWAAVLADLEEIPIPSPADIGYLLFCPLVFSGLVLLVRARVPRAAGTLWADGITAAMAAAALSAAVGLEAVLGIVGGSPLEVATNLAYPVTDLILLGIVVCAVALNGWRLDRTWTLLGAGAVSFWLADSLYLIGTANDTYTANGFVDAFWCAAGVCFAAAAWQPHAAARAAADDITGRRLAVVPISFAACGLAVLIAASVGGSLNLVAVVLAALSIVAVFVRLGMTFRDNVTMLAASRHEALTDSLTGLGNRRALTIALEGTVAADSEPMALVLFDLDGFKHYNDSFGHPAGDALLARMGGALRDRVEGKGTAFRMGGDEFCALLPAAGQDPDMIGRFAGDALTEHGEGFSIGCSFGAVAIPREADDAAEALRVADGRMYMNKHGGRASARRQSSDVLVRALAERTPELGAHLQDTARLAVDVAEQLGLDGDATECIRHAAELHDVGKMAIPDAILDKPGPLDPDEWDFMRTHTVIGERIVAAAPALGVVAPLVRSSHERWDGGGYPDGLAGDAIPLGARIVAVCDAFDAMTTDRPYRAALKPSVALLELRRCAGGQFDPAVVHAFCAAWLTPRVGPPAPPPSQSLVAV